MEAFPCSLLAVDNISEDKKRITYSNNLRMSYKRITPATRGVSFAAHSFLTIIKYNVLPQKPVVIRDLTSWMFGNSNNSLNTKTPGAEVASSTSLTAAAPLADFAISKNGSSLEEKLESIKTSHGPDKPVSNTFSCCTTSS